MPTRLITGSNRGIGLELVRQYAAAGWQVIATCRDPGKALNAMMRNLAIDCGQGKSASRSSIPAGENEHGESASLTLGESVSGIRQTIEGIDLTASGQFFNYNGRILPW